MCAFLFSLIAAAAAAAFRPDQADGSGDQQGKGRKQQSYHDGSQDAGCGECDQQQKRRQEYGSQDPQQSCVQRRAAAGTQPHPAHRQGKQPQVHHGNTPKDPEDHRCQGDGCRDLQKRADDAGKDGTDQGCGSTAASELTSAN